MIERCNHGDVTWDGIRENTASTHGKAVGTCGECGATVASTLSALHEIAHDEGVDQDEDEEAVAKPVVESGPV